jgi:hypothetical protein
MYDIRQRLQHVDHFISKGIKPRFLKVGLFTCSVIIHVDLANIRKEYAGCNDRFKTSVDHAHAIAYELRIMGGDEKPKITKPQILFKFSEIAEHVRDALLSLESACGRLVI